MSVAALAGVIWAAGSPEVWQGLRHANWLWLSAAPVAVLVSHLMYSLTYRKVAQVGEGPDLAHEEAVAIVTTGFGPFTPRGGFSLDTEALRDLGLSRREASLRVRALGMIEYAVLAPATFAGALYMLIVRAPAQAGLLPSWIIGVPLGTAIAVGLLLWYQRAGRPGTWWAGIRHVLAAMEETITVVRCRPNGPLAMAGMCGYWAADIAALAACMSVFVHRQGTAPAIIVGYATGYALTRRTLPLAGAGPVEALLPFALNWVGYPLAPAILAVIAYRVFNLWFVVVPAAAGLRKLRRDAARADTARLTVRPREDVAVGGPQDLLARPPSKSWCQSVAETSTS